MSYVEPPEKVRARAKRWYNKNVDHVRARSKAWKAAHPERVRAYGRRYYWMRKVARICATAGCPHVIEPRQIKFCRDCSAFYKQTIWRTRRVA